DSPLGFFSWLARKNTRILDGAHDRAGWSRSRIATDSDERDDMAQVIGVPKEIFPGEKRVATVPDVVPKLMKLGFGVIVQSGAGEAASLGDEADAAAGGR